jgi:hypothetical protein
MDVGRRGLVMGPDVTIQVFCIYLPNFWESLLKFWKTNDIISVYNLPRWAL